MVDKKVWLIGSASLVLLTITLYAVPSLSGDFLTNNEVKMFADQAKNVKDPSQLSYLSGIKNAIEHWNLSPEKLAEISVTKGQAKKNSTGAISVNTGEFTGRSPKDRFIVKDAITEKAVWWGNINQPFELH